MFEVNDNAFYTLEDLNARLKISIFSLRNWIKQGKLKASKVGRCYMVSGSDTGTAALPAPAAGCSAGTAKNIAC